MTYVTFTIAVGSIIFGIIASSTYAVALACGMILASALNSIMPRREEGELERVFMRIGFKASMDKKRAIEDFIARLNEIERENAGLRRRLREQTT